MECYLRDEDLEPCLLVGTQPAVRHGVNEEWLACVATRPAAEYEAVVSGEFWGLKSWKCNVGEVEVKCGQRASTPRL